MREGTAIATTTHIDGHFERLDRASLDSMAAQLRHQYLPITVEHDPRFPPAGRITGGYVEQLDDGEFALVQTMDFFEPGDTAETTRGDGRQIPLVVTPNERFDVHVDRGVMRNPIGVADLASVGGQPVRHFAKKAIDPIPILLITAGMLVLNDIAQGFFGRLGEDLYERLVQALEQRYEVIDDEMLDLRFGVAIEPPVEVVVLVESPNADHVRPLMRTGLEEVDRLAHYVLTREADIARIVIRRIDGSFRLAYAVRRDGYPVLVDWSIVPSLPEESADA